MLVQAGDVAGDDLHCTGLRQATIAADTPDTEKADDIGMFRLDGVGEARSHKDIEGPIDLVPLGKQLAGKRSRLSASLSPNDGITGPYVAGEIDLLRMDLGRHDQSAPDTELHRAFNDAAGALHVRTFGDDHLVLECDHLVAGIDARLIGREQALGVVHLLYRRGED